MRSYIRHIKQQQIAFWDTHGNISKETALSNDIHNNSGAERIQVVEFDSSIQSSIDEFSEETFDKLEKGANPEIVTETLSFEDLVLTFLLELRELKKASCVSCKFLARSISSFMRVCSQKYQLSFRGYQYGTED